MLSAAKTGIDSSNIRSYEAGRALVGLQSLVKIATVLKVQPGSLLKGLELSMFEKRQPVGVRQIDLEGGRDPDQRPPIMP